MRIAWLVLPVMIGTLAWFAAANPVEAVFPGVATSSNNTVTAGPAGGFGGAGLQSSISLANALITASPTSIEADEASTSTITVQMRDVFGNELDDCPDGETLTLATDFGSLVDDTPDCEGGAYTATLTASGTPQTATITGSFTPSETAIADNATVEFTAAPEPLDVTTASLPAWTVDVAYTSTLAATGGTGPYAWAVTDGALPAGLTLDAGGEISGTPTATGTAEFTVTVTDDAEATAVQVLSITINAPPDITTASLAGGEVDAEYSASVAASDGTGSYSWAVTGGALPAGLNLNAGTGEISGIPAAEETQVFTVTVTDAAGATDAQELSIEIVSAPE